MSTTSANLGLTIAEASDVVDVDAHIAANFSTLDAKWGTPGAPAAVEVGSSGEPGTSTTVARGDHVHGIATATPVSTGTANSAGSAVTVSASDHVHALGTDSVATATIQNSAVTTGKLNDLAVTTGKLNDLAVATGKLNDLAVTTAKLDDLGVTTGKIANGAVTQGKLATESVSPDRLISVDQPANDEVLTYHSSTGNFRWQAASALVSVSGTVPSGLIAAFATAAAIASGWSRFTPADGRVLIGAGTTFGVTFVEDDPYGSSWAHSHSIEHAHPMPHTHTLTAAGITGFSGPAIEQDGAYDSGGATANPINHTHGSGSYDVTGSTDGSGTSNTSGTNTSNSGSTSWIIPSRSVVWAQKS